MVPFLPQAGTPRTGKRPAAFQPKPRVDLVVQDEDAETVIGAIAKSVNTGTIGGGKIWVTAARGQQPGCHP